MGENEMQKIFIFIAIAAIYSSAAYAAPADIPKSGQTTSAATGDDGDLQKGVAWPSTRFTTNADATVTDNLTSLVWAPDGNIIPARDNNWDADGTTNDGMVTWQHALDYVLKLNAESYLGHNDWRLPNINELESLVHAEYTKETTCGGSCTTNAAWLNSQGFSNVQADGYGYWSSTTYAGVTNFAWFVVMYDGGVGCDVKSSTGPFNRYYVWPVRSGL
jgi:hypothetical protein